MGVRIGGTVEKVNGRDLTYAEFAEKYLARNLPVILTGLTDDWKSRKDWAFDDGSPNLEFFSAHCGSSRVQVADCGTRELTDQKRSEMSVSEFIECWTKTSDSSDEPLLLYLKDWHFVKEYPKYVAYNTPTFFHDDWLNLYLDHYRLHNDLDNSQERNDICCSDYRFVYMGAKGTWTPLHADVFRSYSWSANVCGRKQWYFLSPSQHHFVFDRYGKSSVYNIFEDVSKTKFPEFEKAIWFECTQEANEIIFVPSGWYHQVHNLEDTISINHNWFNSYNISWVWDLLLKEYHEAEGYIEDIRDICDDFEGLCQKNLAANAGMDFRDFFILLSRFALANWALLHHLMGDERSMNPNSSQMAKSLLFNLKSIQCTASKMNSIGAWEDRRMGVIDLRETTEDQSFSEFCDALWRNYSKIYEHREFNLNLCPDLLKEKESDLFNLLYPLIYNPDDLVRFLQRVIDVAEINTQ